MNKTSDIQYLKTQSYIAKTAIVETIDDRTYYRYDLDYNISYVKELNEISEIAPEEVVDPIVKEIL